MVNVQSTHLKYASYIWERNVIFYGFGVQNAPINFWRLFGKFAFKNVIMFGYVSSIRDLHEIFRNRSLAESPITPYNSNTDSFQFH